MKVNKNKVSKSKKDTTKSRGASALIRKPAKKATADDSTLVEDKGHKLTLEDASILEWEHDRKKSKGADEEL